MQRGQSRQHLPKRFGWLSSTADPCDESVKFRQKKQLTEIIDDTRHVVNMGRATLSSRLKLLKRLKGYERNIETFFLKTMEAVSRFSSNGVSNAGLALTFQSVPSLILRYTTWLLQSNAGTKMTRLPELFR